MSSSVLTRSGAQKTKVQTRGMVKEIEARKPSAALVEAKRQAKLKLNNNNKAMAQEAGTQSVKDIYSNAMSAATVIRGDTGLIYDERMTQHLCLWDKGHPECPDRFTWVLQRCRDYKLDTRCQILPSRLATKDEVLLKHTEEQYDLLKSTFNSTNEEQLEELSSRYDAIFFHPTTFELSLLSAGSTIELVENILNGSLQNGMAIIRPPGHHAMKAEYNGYCFFNNVAIAAQNALEKGSAQKILIVDWDVHHGQGTQRLFYNDPRVLYFSIHRYEHGEFWPNLRESDFDSIGEKEGTGYNFNIPLNKTGMTDADYLAVFQQVLMPVAMEYQPDLVIVSAGYDAAYGCPEGEMEITPACYSHLLNPLLSLANGRVAVVLEGGYCLESLAESAAITLRTLLGDPCPRVETLEAPSDSIRATILNCIFAHKKYWKNLQLQETYSLEEFNNVNPQPNLHKVLKLFKGTEERPERFQTRDAYPVQSAEDKQRIAMRLQHLKIVTDLKFPASRVCYVYDDFMLEHQNMHENGHPEQPSRIKKIRQRHEEYNLFARMKKLKSRHATTDELCLVHTRQHVNMIRKTVEKTELKEIGEKFNSVYFHPKSFECATMAAGSVLEVVDEVLNGGSRSGVCIIRPPGHHAECDIPHGFCLFNNVAIAAQYAIRDHGLRRVLILDWDIHHGNGTQHIFEASPNVLYISLHRYDYGSFFPKSKDADYGVVGSERGEGYNVNIPWNKKGMTDAEYAAAFQNVVMPIAYDFDPELVLVSAGFDAAIGDPLGGCKVTPEAYGIFTHWLSSLANGRVILCLEGGYNVNSIAYSMTMCSKALLGDPMPPMHISNRGVQSSCWETLRNVISVHKKYWKSLRFDQKLPDFERTPDELLNVDFGLLSISQPTDADSQKSPEKSVASSEEAGPSTSRTDSSTATGSKQTLTDFLCENAQALANEEMFAVVPLKNCPHLCLLTPETAPTSINTKGPCNECQPLNTTENWWCLLCYRVLCGRYVNEHMMFHQLDQEHPLTLSFTDLSVWCYGCEAYIDNPQLYLYKNLAHIDKFNEEIPWSLAVANNDIMIEMFGGGNDDDDDDEESIE